MEVRQPKPQRLVLMALSFYDTAAHEKEKGDILEKRYTAPTPTHEPDLALLNAAAGRTRRKSGIVRSNSIGLPAVLVPLT